MTAPQDFRVADEGLRADDLREIWGFANPEEKVEGFRSLPPSEAEEFFLSLDTRAQAELLTALPANERQLWMRQLPPDDAADLLQAVPAELRERAAAAARRADAPRGLGAARPTPRTRPAA